MPQALDLKNWETNKKKAVEEGVIPDRKTGVGSAIGDYIKVAKDKDKRRAAAMKVRPLLRTPATIPSSSRGTTISISCST